MPYWPKDGETSGMRVAPFLGLSRAGHTINIKRFEPCEVFRSKEEAEAHGLELAKKWVDENGRKVEVCTMIFVLDRSSVILFTGCWGTVVRRSPMEAEYFYHYLRYFFKAESKTIWERNEVLDAIKEQYMELMDKQAVKVKSDEAEPKESPAVMAQLSLLPGQTIL
jgi:hypothetical protein